MAAQNYPACVKFVRRWEGGNSDVKGDRGGRTGKGGVTHNTYDAYRHRKGLLPQDVFLISQAEIDEIYGHEYWAPVGGNDLPFGIDLCLFDISINSGPLRAKCIWEKVRFMGLVGPAMNIEAICAERLRFLRGLHSWRQFGRGWSRRVNDCEVTAMRMAAAVDPAAQRWLVQHGAAKAAKKANTQTGGAVAGGGLIAALHQWFGMPGHMALVAGGLVAALAVYALWRYRAAHKNEAKQS